MSEIVYAVYHDTNKEARSMEVLQCCMEMGHVSIVTYAKPQNIDGVEVYLIDKNSPLALLHFIRTIKKVIMKKNPDYVFLHDNDCSAVIRFIKKRFPNTKIVYDSSELYISLEDSRIEKKEHSRTFENGFSVWLKQRLTGFRRYYEKKDLHRCDVVIAANQERAAIMKNYFRLNRMPLVFDNMHRIDEKIDHVTCERKFQDYININRFNIVFAGGISPERDTIRYAKAVIDLGVSFNLIIAGSASSTAIREYEELRKKDTNNQLHYVGFVSRAELRYLFQKCQASVVVFDKFSLNTLYCASGKLFESLFEQTPILCSENPPLFRLCEETKVGVSDDDYGRGIMNLYQNYEEHLNAVSAFINNLHYEDRINELKLEIEKALN